MTTRAVRFPANYAVVLRKGAALYPCVICNISTGGACLLGVGWAEKGQTFIVDYEFGQTRATVTWKTGNMAGVKFDDKLSETGVQSIRAHQLQAS